MTRRARPADPWWSRTCPTCSLVTEGGEWGYRAHQHTVHGQGEDPGPFPYAHLRTGPDPGKKPWTDARRAEWHRRNRARRRGQRYTPRRGGWPPDGTPPPAGTA